MAGCRILGANSSGAGDTPHPGKVLPAWQAAGFWAQCQISREICPQWKIIGVPPQPENRTAVCFFIFCIERVFKVVK